MPTSLFHGGVRGIAQKSDRAVASSSEPRAARGGVDEGFARRWPPGERRGDYQCVRILGGEGAGRVVLAWRMSGVSGFEKLVALRVMAKGQADAALPGREELALRAKIRHDHVVEIHDLRELGDELMVEMEYVDGLTLEELLESHGVRSLSLEIAVYIASCVLRGLSWVHGGHCSGAPIGAITHGHLRPTNVLVSRAGSVKIAGLEARCHVPSTVDEGSELSWLGASRYLAPEQCGLGETEERSDVYAVGVMLYEILSGGQHPTVREGDGDDYAAILSKRLVPCPLDSAVSGIPRALSGLVERMVAREAEQRPSAERALEELLRTYPFDLMRAQSLLSKQVRRILERDRARPRSAADEVTEWFRSGELAPARGEPSERSECVDRSVHDLGLAERAEPSLVVALVERSARPTRLAHLLFICGALVLVATLAGLSLRR